MKLLKRLGLPLICAWIVVLGTLGIVSANALIHRNINVTIADPLTITPSADTPITVFKGEYQEVVYNINNPSNTPYTVTCSWDTPPTGISIIASPASVYLAPHGNDSITVRVSADETASDCVIFLHFTPS